MNTTALNHAATQTATLTSVHQIPLNDLYTLCQVAQSFKRPAKRAKHPVFDFGLLLKEEGVEAERLRKHCKLVPLHPDVVLQDLEASGGLVDETCQWLYGVPEDGNLQGTYYFYVNFDMKRTGIQDDVSGLLANLTAELERYGFTLSAWEYVPMFGMHYYCTLSK